jgi:ribosome-binding protein aMBF1 (putative translation factor)
MALATSSGQIAARGRLLGARERAELVRQFGGRVRRRRTAAKLSRIELATRCGVAPATVARIEEGRREVSLSLVLILCAGLDSTPDSLLQGLHESVVSSA